MYRCWWQLPRWMNIGDSLSATCRTCVYLKVMFVKYLSDTQSRVWPQQNCAWCKRKEHKAWIKDTKAVNHFRWKCSGFKQTVTLLYMSDSSLRVGFGSPPFFVYYFREGKQADTYLGSRCYLLAREFIMCHGCLPSALLRCLWVRNCMATSLHLCMEPEISRSAGGVLFSMVWPFYTVALLSINFTPLPTLWHAKAQWT